MPLPIVSTRETLAIAYGNIGSWIGIHTADPGTTGASEATGGSPAYIRKQTVWAAGGSDGVITGSQVAFDLPAGTYTHISVWKTVAGGQADLVDKVAITSTVLGAQGQILVTPTCTVT